LADDARVPQFTSISKRFWVKLFPGAKAFHIKSKEDLSMNCHANKSIECTVKQCANHCGTENYCSLDSILVGTHECDPTVDQCTDCMSFHRK